jgi:hypothetical protein
MEGLLLRRHLEVMACRWDAMHDGNASVGERMRKT